MVPAVERMAALQEARRLYADRAWHGAFAALSRLDADEGLPAADLEQLAWSAALIGDDASYLQALERLFHLHLADEAELAAARSAFWLGFRLMAAGEFARGGAWLGRCQQLVDARAEDCAERGYLLLMPIRKHLMAGEFGQAIALAGRATAIGERFSERDLVALSRHLEARCLVQAGRVEEAMALFDEVMLTAASGELSPIVTGLVYCSVIAACQQVFALERAREWSAVLAGWCEAQPELVSFRGSCEVHRSEILQLAGEWQQALAHAERASTGDLSGDRDAVGDALYMQGEIHRLRGALPQAEEAYLKSSRLGRDPQPGLAQLRAAQGQHAVAFAALRRLLGETTTPLARARLLPAYVEICVSLREFAEAEASAAELEGICSRYSAPALEAISAHARGLLLLARGDARAALGPLRRAFYVWQQLGAPYQEARSRVALAEACGALGDSEGAQLCFDAAHALFEELGAASDLAALDAAPRAARSAGGLTPRELEVLRLVATGKTNRMIAELLALSGKTVDRHVSNIFNKIGVTSRAAATAHAYENELL